MSDLAGRILPLALAVAGRTRDDMTARLVLTGDGGGEWLVAMGGGAAGATPDVTVTADVVEWCRLVGDRIAPADLATRSTAIPRSAATSWPRPRRSRRSSDAATRRGAESATCASCRRRRHRRCSPPSPSASSASAALISATMRAISTSGSSPSAVRPALLVVDDAAELLLEVAIFFLSFCSSIFS